MIRGDKAYPVSEGYQCQKASQLDFYQNSRNRWTRPPRRREDGSFEEISWEVAIAEVAARLKSIRDTHGGHALAYYGGGGQGNHMGGAYAGTLRAAMGTRYIYNSLAQEKTGGFLVIDVAMTETARMAHYVLPAASHFEKFVRAIGRWTPLPRKTDQDGLFRQREEMPTSCLPIFAVLCAVLAAVPSGPPLSF